MRHFVSPRSKDSTSSFGRCGSSTSSKRDPNVGSMYVDKHHRVVDNKELDPNDGAIQFVPAFVESSSSNHHHHRDVSWDAILEGTDETLPSTNKPHNISMSSSSTASSSSPKQTSPKNGSRMTSRIASLFSSRANTPKKNHHHATAPASPVHSSSSSGYVGWPGTQDKRGRVQSASTYSESSSAAQQRLAYERELQQAAEREMSRWTGTKRHSSSHDTASPRRADASSRPDDYYLSRALNDSSRTSSSEKSGAAKSSFQNLFDPNNDPWGESSSPSSVSQTRSPSNLSSNHAASSASSYMDVNRRLAYPDLQQQQPSSKQQQQQSLNRYAITEDNVKSIPTTPHRTFAGYRGLLDKTKEVPSLMDAMDSDASSKATSILRDDGSDIFDGISVSKESDVFDNLTASGSSPRKASHHHHHSLHKSRLPARIAEEEVEEPANDGSDFKLVMLPGGLTALSASPEGFQNRRTASDYDDNLTNSDVDQYGFSKTPGFNEMMSAGTKTDFSLFGIDGNIGKRRSMSPAELTASGGSEESSSLFSNPASYDQDAMSIEGDLSEYYIPQHKMKKVIRAYRHFSDAVDKHMSLSDFEREEDEHKAFALFEMRSRVMEKDIERGLERRGGTVTVDDLVTTPYNRTAHRIRDALIVAKAWRDGASPSDVVNTAKLTRREESTYFIKRYSNDSSDTSSTFSSYSAQNNYWWEPVLWLDDTEFSLYRCPSLGPRHMRGVEMFTIGDCQSILLKLTNERCMELRKELHEATRRQIEAEDLLEGDGGDGMMTEAEMEYLSAMDEVKTISKQLVCAEQSFALVRDRIRELVSRYERLLSKIESESFTGAGSTVTYESSYYSEHDSEFWNEREKTIWARRARRAELKAEIAARETLLAQQKVRMIQEEKQRELESLRQQLNELKTESSFGTTECEHSASLAKNMAMHRHDEERVSEAPSRSDKDKIDGVKQRFRERMAARKRQQASAPPSPPGHRLYGARPISPTPSPKDRAAMDFVRSAGEEMYQQLDFYERSLRAVEVSRS